MLSRILFFIPFILPSFGFAHYEGTASYNESRDAEEDGNRLLFQITTLNVYRDAEEDWTFALPDLEEGYADEISAKKLAQCAKYRDASGFSIFGGKFPGKQMQSCLAQAVDESLKPLCDHTRELKAAKKYFEIKGDEEETVGRIDEILEQLEEMKYEIGDELYAMADEFDEIKESVLDDIDEHYDKKGDLTLGQTVIKGLGKVVARSEVGGFTRVLDSKVRNACRGRLDFSNFSKRK